MRSLDRLQPLGLLVLRIVLGAIMIGHGYHKVFGGLSHSVEMARHIGLPGWLGYVSACTEFFGGVAVLAGLFTRCVSVFILINMIVAIWKVHWKNGLIGPGGYEFPLTCAAIALTLILFGAGQMALDAVRGGGGRSSWGRKAK